jgi:hypothetical protein
MNSVDLGSGTADDPWILRTPSLSSTYQAWRDAETLFVQVGTTRLSYQARGIADLHAMLVATGDWTALGNADEGKPVINGPSRPGHVRRSIRSAATTDCARATGAGLRTM